MPWLCGIYKDRPEVCKVYPRADHYQPESCGFIFLGNGKRSGRCLEECDSSCCQLPRENGEPGAAALPTEAGGSPCRHLEWVEKEVKFDPEKQVPTEGDTGDAPVRPPEE